MMRKRTCCTSWKSSAFCLQLTNTFCTLHRKDAYNKSQPLFLHSAWYTKRVKVKSDFNIVAWANQISLKLRKHPEFIGCTQQVNYLQITLDCERIKVIYNWPTLYRAVYKLHPVQCSPLARAPSFESSFFLLISVRDWLFLTDGLNENNNNTWSAQRRWVYNALPETDATFEENASSERETGVFWRRLRAQIIFVSFKSWAAGLRKQTCESATEDEISL